MIHETPTNMRWYTFGHSFKVVAVADNDKEANEYMATHPGASVIAVTGPLVIMADKADKGEPVK